MIVLFLLLMAPAAWAQDSDQESTDVSAAEPSDASDTVPAETPDDEDDTDELYAEEDDDVFIPSEDVKFGQSIPFPTDI
jgi:hypothetical protein